MSRHQPQFGRRLLSLFLIAVGLSLWTGCGELDDGIEEAPPAPPDVTEVRRSPLIDCTKKKMKAYDSGQYIGKITVIKIDGEYVEVNMASAYEKMRRAAAKDGVYLHINSGFRTMSEQEYLYNCYITGSCNGGNLAAVPGTSNHQSGHALDLNTSSSSVYSWLNANAGHFGFERTVPSESWHWEYWGPKVRPQVCGGASKPRYVAEFDVRLAPNRDNPLRDGRSKRVTDVMVGSQLNGIIYVRNRSNRRLKRVVVGYHYDRHWLKALKYTIQVRKKNKKKWHNAYRAMRSYNNQRRRHLRPNGRIVIGSMAPGERRRIVVRFRAKENSLAMKRHVEFRGWIRSVKKVYGPAKHFGSKPKKNRFRHRKTHRGRARVDIISPTTWQFDGHNRRDIEGWRRCRNQSTLKLLVNRRTKYRGSLLVRGAGPHPCVKSPRWTHVKTRRYDQMVIRIKSFGGPHQMAVLWKRSNKKRFKRARRVTFEVAGNGRFETLVIPMGDHPRWRGVARRLRIDPEIRAPETCDQHPEYLIDRVFFQNSSTHKTSSPRESYINEPEVTLL